MTGFLKRNLNEFKTFALRGNVVDMAVGIIIGAAFGKIVDSMVKDVIMPPLGWMMGKVDFSNLYLTLPDSNGEILKYPSLEAAQAAGAVTINYGIFINTLITWSSKNHVNICTTGNLQKKRSCLIHFNKFGTTSLFCYYLSNYSK